MGFSIKLKNHPDQQDWAFVKSLDSLDDVKRLKSLCKKGFYGFSAQFIPVRTNNTKNFVQDFFFPAESRSAIKVHSCCLEKFFIRMMEGILDLVTLPIRCLTLVPRFLYNELYSKKKDPFFHYLKAQGVEGELLKNDFIYVKYEWEEKILGVSKIFEEETYKGFIDLPNKIEWQTKSFRSKSKLP